MMQQRWVSAAVTIPLFLGLVFWGALPFGIAVFALAAVALGEMLRAYEAAGIAVNLPAAVTGLFLPAWFWIEARAVANPASGKMLVAGLLWLIAAMIWEVVSAMRAEVIQAGRNFAYGLLCAAYVSLFAGMVWLRQLEGPQLSGVIPVEQGVGATLLAVLCVWATDTFALFVGRTIGKRKLAPKLSPGKTVAGAVGGLAASLFFGALFGWLLFRDAVLGLTIGGIAGTFGQFGDLFKSALKREIGIKDFGSILPGHGGVLDRFDSLLFVAPLAALTFHVWPHP
jgi:phosphatidate cytidylyltransferase